MHTITKSQKHVGVTVGILIILIFLWFCNCVHHCGTIKSALILLMHGTNMNTLEKFSNFKLHENPSSGSPVPCGRTDGLEANSRFSHGLKKKQVIEHKMCGLIYSTNSVWNIRHSKATSCVAATSLHALPCACRRLAFLCPTWQRTASSTMASLRARNLFLLENSALKFDGIGVGRRSKHDIFQSRYQLREILSPP
jgi:hypothetical protein